MIAREEVRLRALRDALPGQVLKGTNEQRYPIAELIGEGGQGWVFKANWNEPHGSVVVVKVLRPDAMNADTLARFRREATVFRMLSQQSTPNPHVVRFFDHAQATIVVERTRETWTLPFTVLEYVHGSSLDQVIARTGALAVARVRRLLRHIVLALDAVHAQNVIHRDLKPSNVLVDASGGQELAKVTDFGLAKLHEPSFHKTVALAGATVGYAPPEQFEYGNQRVGRHTDVFSLAAMTYEMLSSKPAFPFNAGDHPLLLVTRILNEARPALARVGESLSPELKMRPDVVALVDVELARALSPSPTDRHASAREFGDAVDRALALVDGARPSSASTPPSPSVSVRVASVLTEAPTMNAGAEALKTIPDARAAPSTGSGPHSMGPTSRRSGTWGWTVVTPAIGPGALRAASIAPDGSAAVCVGAAGVGRWGANRWDAVALRGSLDLGSVRAVACADGGDVLLVGVGGLAARVGASGAVASVRGVGSDFALFGVTVDSRGDALLAGQRGTSGVVVELAESQVVRVTDVPGCPRLVAVARVGGRTVLACGDGGAVATVSDRGVARATSACAAGLSSITALSDGTAVAAGAGGYVFHVTPALHVQLEAIQTMRDLWCLHVAEDGTAWTGGAQGRVLRRTPTGWLRMGTDVATEARVLALWTRSGRSLALCDDGMVIVGELR